MNGVGTMHEKVNGCYYHRGTEKKVCISPVVMLTYLIHSSINEILITLRSKMQLL